MGDPRWGASSPQRLRLSPTGAEDVQNAANFAASEAGEADGFLPDLSPEIDSRPPSPVPPQPVLTTYSSRGPGAGSPVPKLAPELLLPPMWGLTVQNRGSINQVGYNDSCEFIFSQLFLIPRLHLLGLT